LVQAGISKLQGLKSLGVCRSTYYGWLRAKKPKETTPSLLQLTPVEKQAVVEKKKLEPQLSHRQISGSLRPEGCWVSSSSCYRILKPLGWISSPNLREAPWKIPRYEPFRPNQIWGEDWTILSIDSIRHYLLTIIDYFSRYIVAWGVVKTVTRQEVQSLLALAYLSEGIRPEDLKPLLRADLGSPNMAHSTRRLIRDLEMVLSPSRPNRPTDNGRQERWYRTAKQEEIYCYPTYPTVEIARFSLGRYIHYYNEQRPHQALWNYPPGYVHRLGNKSKLLEHYKTRVQLVKEQRLQVNRSLQKEAFMVVSN
jgi:putative transposase